MSLKPETDLSILILLDCALILKVQHQKVNKKIIESDNDLYSEGAVIQGSEKIKLIHKVKQYKHLFPEIPEIKNFKIKPNASEAELKNYIIGILKITILLIIEVNYFQSKKMIPLQPKHLKLSQT